MTFYDGFLLCERFKSIVLVWSADTSRLASSFFLSQETEMVTLNFDFWLLREGLLPQWLIIWILNFIKGPTRISCLGTSTACALLADYYFLFKNSDVLKLVPASFSSLENTNRKQPPPKMMNNTDLKIVLIRSSHSGGNLKRDEWGDDSISGKLLSWRKFE